MFDIFALLRELIFFVSYVSNGSSFPQPMSVEEERDCLRRYLEMKDPEARRELIERNLRLVAHIAKKYGNTGKDIDDLISIGVIGLIKAVNTFNAERSTQLAAYAARCIDNEILMTIRAGKKEKRVVSLQEPIGTDQEGNEISLIDVLGADNENVLEKAEMRIQARSVSALLDRVLNRRERMVLRMRYGLSKDDGMTQREVAKALGISRSYVSRIEKKAITKLSHEIDPSARNPY